MRIFFTSHHKPPVVLKRILEIFKTSVVLKESDWTYLNNDFKFRHEGNMSYCIHIKGYPKHIPPEFYATVL